MTIYNTNKASATPKYLDTAAGVNVISTYTFPATGLPTLALNDTFVCATLPAGCSIFDVNLDIDKLDGGGGPTLVVSVGDVANPARYISAATTGRTGGYQGANVNGWTGFTPTVNTPVIITVTTGASAAVPANAGLRLVIAYTADP